MRCAHDEAIRTDNSSPAQSSLLRGQRIILLCLSLVGVLVVLGIGTIASQSTFTDFSNLSEGNPIRSNWQQYDLLGDALLNGRTNLDLEVSSTLMQLENPYDYQARMDASQEDSSFYWYFDTAYYKGKYYCYFGVIPALLFYAPYQAITHTFLPTSILVIALGCVSCFLCTYIVLCIKKTWFPGMKFQIAVLSIVVLFIGSNILACVYFPTFYNVPIIASLDFTLLGLSFWINARGNAVRPFPRVKLVLLGAFFLSLNIGTRPQFTLAALLALPIFYRDIANLARHHKRNNLAVCCIAGISPFILVAVGICSYNYVRFGSCFDFGANYNLTGFDMTHHGQAWSVTARLLYHYLFSKPDLSHFFPFINGVVCSYLNEISSDFVPTEPIPCGLFFLAPINFALLLSLCPAIRKHMIDNGIFCLLVSLVIIPVIVIVADSRVAGISWRYYTDFAWYFALASLLIIMTIETSTTRVVRTAVMSLAVIAVCVSLILYGCSLLSPTTTTFWVPLASGNPELYAQIAGFFA